MKKIEDLNMRERIFWIIITIITYLPMMIYFFIKGGIEEATFFVNDTHEGFCKLLRIKTKKQRHYEEMDRIFWEEQRKFWEDYKKRQAEEEEEENNKPTAGPTATQDF